MSPVAPQRFVVTGFDHDLWRIVIEARSEAQAVRKVTAIWATETQPGTPGGREDWRVEPLKEIQDRLL